MSATQGEPEGYMSAKQMSTGMIHLISSRNLYGFNLSWLFDPAIYIFAPSCGEFAGSSKCVSNNDTNASF
eukprot:SAG11_NODE_1256_length_5374_cov_5.627627_6_plen_70_part_00